MKTFVTTLVALCVCIAAPRASSRAHGAPSGLFATQTIARILDATVEVVVDGRTVAGGAFVGHEGYILTACHVFDAPRIRLEIESRVYGRRLADLVAMDRGANLALVRMSGPRIKTSQTLVIAKEPATTTDRAFNVSRPHQQGPAILEGSVATHWSSYGFHAPTGIYLKCFLVSGAPSATMPGSPWIDGVGQLIGIHVGRIQGQKGKLTDLSMVAPPVAMARLLKTKRDAKTKALGGQVIPLRSADEQWTSFYGPLAEGLLVTDVNKGGELEGASVEPGDVIVTCNGEDLKERADLLGILRATRSGRSINLRIRSHKDASYRAAAVKLSVLEQAWRKKHGR